MEREGASIARGLRRRDPDVLEHLIERYQHRLLRYLLYLTSNRETAEDIFQETWMRVLERGGQYNGKTRFETWLFAIARNLVIDLARRKKPASLDSMRDPQNNAAPLEVVDAGPLPLQVLSGREQAIQVAAAVECLDPLHREVLVLRFQEEMTLEEIAAIVDAPLSTIKSRLYRGLAALRPSLDPAYPAAAADSDAKKGKGPRHG